MIERKAISVSLAPEWHAVVRDLAGTGTYGSVGAVARAGLRRLRGQEAGAWDRPRGRGAQARPTAHPKGS